VAVVVPESKTALERPSETIWTPWPLFNQVEADRLLPNWRAVKNARARGRILNLWLTFKLGTLEASLDVPEVMAHLMRIPLHDVEGTDLAGLWVVRCHVVRGFESRLAPPLGGVDQRDEADDW
jgi:hypothetical protein